MPILYTITPDAIVPGGRIKFQGFATIDEKDGDGFLPVKLPWPVAGIEGYMFHPGLEGIPTVFSSFFEAEEATDAGATSLCHSCYTGYDPARYTTPILGAGTLDRMWTVLPPEVRTSGTVITEKFDKTWDVGFGALFDVGGALEAGVNTAPNTGNMDEWWFRGWIQRASPKLLPDIVPAYLV